MKKSIKKTIKFATLACMLTLATSMATACSCGKQPDDSSSGGSPAPQSSVAPAWDDYGVETAMLKTGSSGSEVREVQRRLKLWGYYKGSVDGVFGNGTKSAVVAFQKKNGLKADGVVGKSTYKALGMTSSYEILAGQTSGNTTNGQATGGFSSSEVYLLAKTVYAEGRGEPYTGQVAIAAVVLNRVRDKAFPNTISGVVYQKHAFTAVTDGQINLEPNATAMKAAKDAINGWDPTGGALYYYNPAVATSSWIFDRQTVTVIGKHVFAI